MAYFMIFNFNNFNNFVDLLDQSVNNPILNFGCKKYFGNTVIFDSIGINPFNINLSFCQ